MKTLTLWLCVCSLVPGQAGTVTAMHQGLVTNDRSVLPLSSSPAVQEFLSKAGIPAAWLDPETSVSCEEVRERDCLGSLIKASAAMGADGLNRRSLLIINFAKHVYLEWEQDAYIAKLLHSLPPLFAR